MKNLKRSFWLALAAAGLFSSAARAAGPFQFYSVTPCRLADTRNPNGLTGGPALAGQGVRSFPVVGLCGVPATAQAAVLNVTVVAPTGGGHVRIWPYNATMPLVSTINFDPGEPAIANGAIVPLSSDPTLSISTFLGASSGNTAHLVIDVTGYFQ
jgi:hypothetical protein